MSYETKEERLALANIDPEFEEILKKMNAPPPDYSDVREFKKVFAARTEQTIAELGSPPPEISQTDHQISMRDGYKSRIRVYKPVPAQESGSPLIVMYHGGGFCIGSLEGEERSCRNFVQAFGAICVSTSYRLAPEHPFPAAPDDAWDTLQWVAKNAKSLGADPSQGFIVGGTSAGGNLSAVMTHLARDEKLSPPLTGQYLSIPLVLPHSVAPEKYKEFLLSEQQTRAAPILPKEAIDMFNGAYKADYHDPRYAVFNHPKGHADLPPAFFQVCGMDALRDEAILYDRVLREDYGIKTRFQIYPGLPHGFFGFFPMLKSSAKFREDMIDGIGWLLGKEPKMDKIRTAGTEGAVV